MLGLGSEEMIKCAIITPGFLPVPAVDGGAVETLVTNLIEANEKEKYFDFDVFTIESKKDFDFKYSNSSIHVIKVSRFYRFLDKTINKILSILKINNYVSRYVTLVSNVIKKSKKKYDYILIENNMYLYKKVFESYKENTKFIFHLHNDIGNRDKPDKLCKFISNTAYRVLTVSEFLNSRFKQFTGCKNVKTYYNCINIKKFLSGINEYINRESLNIKQDDTVFMYIGRFSSEKGLLELIIAFKEICKTYNNIKLLIVGDNTGSDNYTERIKKTCYGLEDKIIFSGYVNNDMLVNYYKLCDIVIIPSTCDEAFGIVALEAMLMKKPLIVSNRGGIPEVVNKDYAILVNKDNFIDGLQGAMKKMMDQKSNQSTMGKNGYNKFVSNKAFDSQYYFENFIDYIK